MRINKEKIAIMDHTVHRAAGGVYCGDSRDMQEMVDDGLMESAGKKSFVPSEYFRITARGRGVLQAGTDGAE